MSNYVPYCYISLYVLADNIYLLVENKRATWSQLLYSFSSYALNIFRTLIYLSSGAYDFLLNCFSLQHVYHSNPTTPKHQHTSKQEHTTNVVIQQNSRKLLMMDILMSETCWAHKKWIRNSKWHEVSLSFSTTTMMHGEINIIFIY